MLRSETIFRTNRLKAVLDLKLTIDCRILENQHLLDATEIFRKLNVHKKVLLPFLSASMTSNPLTNPSGVFLQVGVPLGDVLFLSILDDSGPYKGRSKLIAGGGKQNHEIWRQCLGEREFGREENVPIAGEYRRFGRYDCTLGKLHARRRLYGVRCMNDIASGSWRPREIGRAVSK